MRIRNAIAAMTIGCVASLAAAQDDRAVTPPAQDDVLVKSAPGDFKVLRQRLHEDGGDVLFVLDEGRHEKGAYLGISTSPPAEAVRQQLKLSQGTGLGVDFVEPGSPASDAGLKQYDVITKLDDQILIDAHQLAVLVRMHKPGEEVTLTVIREGKTQTLKAKLVEHELPPLDVLGNFNGPIFDNFIAPPQPGGQPDVRALPGPGQQPQRFQFRLKPGAGGLSTTTFADGEHTLTVTSTPDSKQKKLVATDRNGTVLFDGPIDTPEERAKMPTIVADKLKKLEAATTKPPQVKEPAANNKEDGTSGKNDKKPEGPDEEVEIQIKS